MRSTRSPSMLATRHAARAIVAPAKNLGHDLDAMASAIASDTALIYIANPNNPTGTHLRAEAIEAFLAGVPARVVVVIDEAYNEYSATRASFQQCPLGTKVSRIC